MSSACPVHVESIAMSSGAPKLVNSLETREGDRDTSTKMTNIHTAVAASIVTDRAMGVTRKIFREGRDFQGKTFFSFLTQNCKTNSNFANWMNQ